MIFTFLCGQLENITTWFCSFYCATLIFSWWVLEKNKPHHISKSLFSELRIASNETVSANSASIFLTINAI